VTQEIRIKFISTASNDPSLGENDHHDFHSKESSHMNFRQISLLIVVGAIGFWTPDVVLNAFNANSISLFTLLPTFGFLAGYQITTRIRQEGEQPSVAVFMIVGVWLFASVAMMIGASFSGGGFAGSISETVIVIVLGLLPPYTLIMSTYDGSLYALLLTTLIAFGAHFLLEPEHWILPPNLRNRLRHWYEQRVIKDI
jgi:hypothetical protein